MQPRRPYRSAQETYGWQGWQCASARQTAVVGTTGAGLRMEAVEIVV
ncbi:hypothetical protein [Kitasatospora aureofaciens]|nr:hypothetical protein [Kitasatospora aureofaciens]